MAGMRLGAPRRRRIAPWLLLGLVQAAAAGELLIEQRVADDGALLVRYAPPDGVRELPLFDRSDAMATVWGEMAAPTDTCGSVTLQPRPTLRVAEGCTAASFRIAPRVLGRHATYEPAFAVGTSAVVSYSGYYAVALPGHSLHWRWVPAPGAHALVAGQLSSQAVDRIFTADQATAATQDGGSTQAGWAAIAANEYAFVGRALLEALPGGTLIHDGQLDPGRLNAVRTTLASATARFTKAYGAAPAGPWSVVAVTSPATRGFFGDVSASRMMSLRFNPEVPQDVAAATRHTRRFVSHELTHWWDTGVFRTDWARPWIHEGHADWMAALLMRETGATDAPRWRQELDAALNACQFARGDKPAATLPPGFHRDDDPYACGQVLWLLAQSARPQGSAPLDIAASVFRGSTAPVDAEAVARWADGGATGPMHRLLQDPRLGFATALKRDWAGVIEATPLQAGLPLPDGVRSRLASTLMQALMSADCGGSIGFWTQADHFRIQALPGCRALRGDMRVQRIGGVSPFTDPVAAWAAARAACTAGQPLLLTLDGGEPVTLACPAPLPELPIHDTLRVRPQALARMGLDP